MPCWLILPYILAGPTTLANFQMAATSPLRPNLNYRSKQPTYLGPSVATHKSVYQACKCQYMIDHEAAM